MRRLLKWLLWAVAAVLLLVAAGLLVIQTDAFRSWLREQVEREASAAIAGEVTLGAIEGNFLSHLALRDLAVQREGETVARLAMLGVWLDPWPLLSGEVLVDSIVVAGPELHLVQGPDSLWNVQRLLPPPDSATAEAEDDGGGALSIVVVVERFILRRGLVTLEPLDSAAAIPRRVDGITLAASAYLRPNETGLSLERFALTTHEPDLTLANLSGRVTVADSVVTIADVRLATARNAVRGKGRLADPSQVELATDPLVFEEFRVFLGKLDMPARPVIETEARMWDDSLAARIVLSESTQRVELRTFVSGFADSTGTAPLRYGLDGTLRGVDPYRWTGDTTLRAAIDGEVTVRGRGVDPATMDTRVALNLRPGRIMGQHIERVDLRGRLADNRLSVDGRVEGDAGAIYLDTGVRDPLNAARLDLLARVTGFDLAVASGDTSLASDLNLTLEARLSGTGLADLQGDVDLDMRPSILAGFAIDSLRARLATTANRIVLDTLRLDSAPLGITAAGWVGRTDSTLSLNAVVMPRDLTALRDLTGMDTLAAGGRIAMDIAGTIAAPSLRTRLDLHDLEAMGSTLATLTGSVEADLGPSIVARADLTAKTVASGGLVVERLAISGDGGPDSLHAVVEAVLKDSSRATVVSDVVRRDSVVTVWLPRLALAVGGQEWGTVSDSARVRLAGDTVSVGGLTLASGDQRIRVAGRMVTDGPISGRLRIDDLAVAPLAALDPALPPLEGRIFTRVDVAGSLVAPRIDGRVVVREPRVSAYPLDSLAMTVSLGDSLLEGTLLVAQDNGKAIRGAARLPVNLAPGDSGSVLVADRPAEIDLTSAGYDLDMMAALSPLIESMSGALQLDARLRGTLAEPELSGSVTVANAAFSSTLYGIRYRQMGLELRLTGDRAILEKLEARRDNGFVRASGTLTFDSSLVTGRIASSDIQMTAKDFLVAQSKELELRIDADTWLRGGAADPTFGGGITVRRSRIYLPAFVAEAGGAAGEGGESLPLLVAARRSEGAVSGAPQAPIGEATGDSTAELADYLGRLEGTLKLSIPRNTWIKSPEMNMELAGDLEAVKTGPDLELFGTIRIVRGNYTLLGKRFVVREGSFSFTGGTEMEPDISLVAEHVFRAADRSKNEMVVTVSGPAFTPELAFTLNGTAISEGDALSYLLFGRSLDALSSGQRSQVAGDGGDGDSDLARNLAAGLIAGQLQKHLGESLNLDVIEIRGDENWQSTTFVVGKYVTNDLFLSYKREFGDVQSDRSSLEVVTMEYELTRFLYLQLIQGNDVTSGADVIFKFER